MPTQPSSTYMTPLEEALFRSWLHANGIPWRNDPDKELPFDYRPMYQMLGGQVLPWGTLAKSGDKAAQHAEVLQQASTGMTPAVPQEPEDTRSDTEKDPLRTLIDLMKERNKSKQLDIKAYDQWHPKPIR